MLSLTSFRSDFSRRAGAVLLALALLVQVLALPLSHGMVLKKAMWESGAQTIEICTAHGLSQVKVGADGQAAPAEMEKCTQCVYCLVAMLGWLPISIAKIGASWLQGTALLLPVADLGTASVFRVWPPAHAPPAR